MAFIEWNDAAKVGVTFIDNDHKKLFQLVNNLYDAMKEGKGKEMVGTTLKEMVSYTDYHFKNEENMMATHGYPEFPDHKKIHDELRKKATDLLANYNSGNTGLAIEVTDFLKTWLQHHISQIDKKLADFLKTKGVS